MSGSAQPTAQLLPPREPPKPPEPWAARPEVDAIRAMLLAGELTTLTTDGRGGLGKTALAAKLAWDPALRAHFTDGILWVSLGKAPDVMGELSRLAARFSVDVSSYDTMVSRGEIVRYLLANKNCLLIVDDAWDVGVARVFYELAPGPILLTTRLKSIAAEIDPRSFMSLGQLAEAESFTLLQRLVAGSGADQAPELPRLAVLAGGLPLTLRLMGPIIVREARLGLGLAKVVAEIENPKWRGDRLDQMVELSLSDLNEVYHLAFAQLGAFEARPADFDVPAVTAVWEVVEQEVVSWLITFVDRNLVDAEGKGRFSLHQSIADVAITRLLAYGDSFANQADEEN